MLSADRVEHATQFVNIGWAPVSSGFTVGFPPPDGHNMVEFSVQWEKQTLMLYAASGVMISSGIASKHDNANTAFWHQPFNQGANLNFLGIRGSGALSGWVMRNGSQWQGMFSGFATTDSGIRDLGGDYWSFSGRLWLQSASGAVGFQSLSGEDGRYSATAHAGWRA